MTITQALRVPLREVLYALGLFSWVIVVVQGISKAVYEVARRKYGSEYVGIYFARKVIHILAGGLVALVIPLFDLFSSFLLPLTLALVLALFCWWPHHTGKLMYWFQDPSNMYEVDFCLVWGAIMTLSWLLTGGWWLGVVPILFMAVG
ncbi:dolichol kinase, partial [Candidatus Bathyarchaeota archaeon ex4484_135]